MKKQKELASRLKILEIPLYESNFYKNTYSNKIEVKTQ